MKLNSLKTVLTIAALAASAVAFAKPPPPPLEVQDMQVQGEIEKANIAFTLSFRAICREANRELAVVTGNMVLKEMPAPADEKVMVRYDEAKKTYFMLFPAKGEYDVRITFAARPMVLSDNQWREAIFSIPSSRARKLEITSDRTDLEVKFPGALRVEREADDETLTLTALLGPGKPFAVQWKPQIAELEGKLVVASRANTVATVRAGALRLDSLFLFEVAQGKLRELSFALPEDLNVTQVRCAFIQDWRIETVDGTRRLHVVLNRPVTGEHGVQLLAEKTLPDFPADINLPVIQPLNVIRTTGHLTVGTDSAVQLIVDRTASLSQVEATAFPRVILDREHPRPLPRAKAFYYQYAATPYVMKLKLDDIVPSYDARYRVGINVKEDDMTVEGQIDRDVVDAPLWNLKVMIESNLVVADVASRYLEDYSVRTPPDDAPYQEVDIRFAQPVQGRALIQFRTELGRGPLDEPQTIRGLSVVGAKNERGEVTISAERGVLVKEVATNKLRRAPTGSVSSQAPNAQYAFRIGGSDWDLTLTAAAKPAAILAEPFHLVSIGEGIMYGSVVVNYYISGAPVDQFQFTLPDRCRNVEFVGSDVRRWTEKDGVWTVSLQRKVIGEYNLGISYNQRYEDGESILVGGVACENVETQSGFMAVTSQLNLDIVPRRIDDEHVLEVEREELPATYRTMTRHPILRSYKYVRAPHEVELAISPYKQGAVLPVLIEVMDLNTEITVNDMGQTESITRIFYKIKNASNQYISLEMPDNTSYAVARLLRDAENASENNSEPINAQLDKKTGMLMIPLPRHRFPDEPITFELEYGQTHGTCGAFDTVLFDAPRTPVRSTFAEWTVQPPQEWNLHTAGGNMLAHSQPQGVSGLGTVVRRAANSWAWAMGRAEEYTGLVAFLAIAAFAVLIALVFLSRRSIPAVLTIAGLVLIAGLGALATQAPAFAWEPTPMAAAGQLAFQQALDLDQSAGLHVAVRLVPAWMLAPLPRLIAAAVVAVACLFVALRTKRRWLPAAVGAWAVCYLVAGFWFGAEFVGHALTWGLPLALLALSVKHYAWGMVRVAPAQAVATLAALLVFASPFTTPDTHAMASPAVTAGYETIVKSIDCQLTAEDDSMLTELTVQFRTTTPFSMPLLPDDAVLLSDTKLADGIYLVQTDHGYTLEVEEPGAYSIALRYLTPLPPADENTRIRRFEMPLPKALANTVSLKVPETGLDVASPTAVELSQDETEDATVATALFSPGHRVIFAWKPRTRKTELEKTSFFTRVLTVARFDTGLAEAQHNLRFQVAQGELTELQIAIPENMTVTAVRGPAIGAWRFEPSTHELEVKLAEAATVEYQLSVVTQISRNEMPYTAVVRPLVVKDTNQQRGILGVAMSSAVYGDVKTHPQKMNLEDFLRDAAAMIHEASALTPASIRHAYRVREIEDALEVSVHEVQPEIRTTEDTVFTVEDEHLTLAGAFDVLIEKAGVFSVNLTIPDGYDVETLTSAAVSHWDQLDVQGKRVVQIHFKQKLQGLARLQLKLTKPVVETPETLTVPRVGVEGAVKHGGTIRITASRGVRLSVDPRNRHGVSEIDPGELGISDRKTLAYKLLKPEWVLTLNTEIIEPRINVNFLHIARVSEGRAKHTHMLRYRFFNAGTKFFTVKVPANALGLQITGPGIARLERLDESRGIWRVELNKKWFDDPYTLSVNYETQYDRTDGTVDIPHVKAEDVDLQRGHVVVFSNERVELSATEVGSGLQRADARNVPAYFRQGDLSGAAFCFRSPDPVFKLAFNAIRHGAAEMLEAEVLKTDIITVVSDEGETINQVQMQLRVGDKRHLELRLPERGEIWSLIVNGAATLPSKRASDNGEEVILIPMAQTSAGNLEVNLEFIFVVPPQKGWTREAQQYHGPRFDVPLKNIRWAVYVPQNLRYKDLSGTLNVNRETAQAAYVEGYGITSYEQQVETRKRRNLAKGKELKSIGNKLAQEGEVAQAKQLLEWSVNYSQTDEGETEDARVQLRNVMRDNTMAGLVNRRVQLRQQQPGAAAQMQTADVPQQEQFDQQELQRIKASLSREDSDNLNRIIDRLLDTQEAATRTMAQFAIVLPKRGRLLEFTRPLQVEVNAPMSVSFEASPSPSRFVGPEWQWTLGLLAGLLALGFLIPRIIAWATPNPRHSVDPEADDDWLSAEDEPAKEEVREDFESEE